MKNQSVQYASPMLLARIHNASTNNLFLSDIIGAPMR
jgi:hypothetical protein